MIPSALITVIRKRFALDWNGIHGAGHWARVRHIGLSLARHTGAKAPIVELFAFLHDSCRRSDGSDPQHGARAVLFAERINRQVLRLSEGDLDLLVHACMAHSDGESHSEPTIATCWDADRLDLCRLGITPDLRRLATTAATQPDFYAWAVSYSGNAA